MAVKCSTIGRYDSIPNIFVQTQKQEAVDLMNTNIAKYCNIKRHNYS